MAQLRENVNKLKEHCNFPAGFSVYNRSIERIDLYWRSVKQNMFVKGVDMNQLNGWESVRAVIIGIPL